MSNSNKVSEIHSRAETIMSTVFCLGELAAAAYLKVKGLDGGEVAAGTIVAAPVNLLIGLGVAGVYRNVSLDKEG